MVPYESSTIRGHQVGEPANAHIAQYLKQRQVQRLGACAQVLLEAADVSRVVEGLRVLFPFVQVLRLHMCQVICLWHTAAAM